MEKYLIDQYGVIEDENWLTHEDEIVEYFKDCGDEYLDCGQGYSQDEAELICKIGDKFYEVCITAEIMSAKQDRGDRLYWVDYISNVTYEEIPKPQPKPKKNFAYSVHVTHEQHDALNRFLKTNNIEHNMEVVTND